MGYIFDALNRLLGNEGSGRPADRKETEPLTHAAARPRPVEADLTQAHWGALDGSDGLAPASDSTLENDIDSDDAPQSTRDQASPGPFQFEDRSALIDNDSLLTDDRLIAIRRPSSVMAEEYRSVRTSMLARWDQRRHLVHTITSATPQEGKTITTLNLGLTFAELRNRRVVVLEADLRLPLFQKMISLPSQPGLVSLLEGRAELSQTIHRLANDRLHVITAGERVNNKRAVQLLSSSRMASLIQTLRQSYDHVIIDTPPVVELADAGILGAISDEVLLIVRINRTPRPLVEQAIRTLTSYNALVGGLIATDQQRARRRYYYKYSYKDGYAYGYTGGRTSRQAA